MNKIFNLFKRLYNKKIDASGLAVFRIFYGLVLLADVIQLFYFRHLIFDEIPFLVPSEIDFSIPLIAWMITIIFIIFGLFTREAAIINYIFSLIFLSTIDTYEYHMYYIYVGINFLLIFTNISKSGSLDALWLKLKYSNTRVVYNPSKKTSVLNYYVLVLIGIAFVYFDSVFYKFASPLWLDGLGVWLPASVPQITHSDTTFLLNQKWLVIAMGYLTLIFETIFIFTFFRKKWRIPLLIIGIGLHVGIIIEFPIPRFGMGFIALYLLLVPVNFWRKLRQKLQYKNPILTFFYDEECPLCNRTRIILGYHDFFKAIEFKGVQTYGFEDKRLKGYSKDELLDNIYSITQKGKVLSGIDTYKKSFKYIPLLFSLGVLMSLPGIYHFAKAVYVKIAKNRFVDRCTEENCGFTPLSFPKNIDEMKISKNLTLKDLKLYFIISGLVLLILFQFNSTYNTPLSNKFKEFIGLKDNPIENSIQYISRPIKGWGKKLFGISSHGVFVNSHFQNYNHTIAVVYLNDEREIWLPITNMDGSLGSWQVGPIWAKWGFRVNSANIDKVQLEQGLRDFTAFWAYKNNVDLKFSKFKILIKKNASPSVWEKNFLKEQLSNLWISGGYVEWKYEEFYPHIKDIESL